MNGGQNKEHFEVEPTNDLAGSTDLTHGSSLATEQQQIMYQSMPHFGS